MLLMKSICQLDWTNLYYHIQNMEFDWTISISDIISYILTILGFGIAIWQFNHQISKDRDNRNKECKTTWFLNVIVLPHIENINSFYKNLLDEINTVTEELIKIKNSPHNDYLEKRTELCAKQKMYISDFFEFLYPLISSYSFELGKEVMKIKYDLEDSITKYLEKDTHSLNDNEHRLIRVYITSNKQELLKTLYSELSVNQQKSQTKISFWSRLKSLFSCQ